MEFKLSDVSPDYSVKAANCFLKCEGNPHEEGTCRLACELLICDRGDCMPRDIILEKMKKGKSKN